MFTLRWSVSEHPERWAGAVFLLSLSSLAIPAYQWLHAERENVGAVPRAIDKQGEQTREWLRANALPIIQGAVDKANERTKQGLDVVQGAASQVVGPDGQVASLRGDVMELAGLLSGRIGEGLQEIQDLRSSLAPAIANINTASAELPGALRDGRFLMARSARAVGHIEQASDKIEAAVPRMIQIAEQTGGNIQRATDESALTAQQSRIFMGHLSEATKPLPAWARIGLAVAPPVVQTGFTVGSWLALRGKSK